MGRVFVDISMSLDGFVAGPNPTLEEPLGEGGERLHEWVFELESWRGPHGLEGGRKDQDSDVLDEAFKRAGAVVMGRRMFSGGSGAWADDPKADGWWGEEPPFHGPVFVVTHHEREPLPRQGGTTFTFVTDGVAAAIEQARRAAGGKDVALGGGAAVIQQGLRAGLVDDLQLHVVPLLLGGGVRLFEGLDVAGLHLTKSRVIDSPQVTHLKFEVR